MHPSNLEPHSWCPSENGEMLSVTSYLCRMKRSCCYADVYLHIGYPLLDVEY
jgi:hypothetical protein